MPSVPPPPACFQVLEVDMSSIDVAYDFYLRHIYDEDKIKLLETHNLKVAGSVPSVLWELFGALLTEKSGAGNTGADLIGWEVKSARSGGSYEYQYHLNTGAEKLYEDCVVNHLFCTYSPSYKDVSVRTMTGQSLSDNFFTKWIPQYHENYNHSVSSGTRRQRFRKNIPFGYVETNGILVLKIENGIIAYRDDELIPYFNERLSL